MAGILLRHENHRVITFVPYRADTSGSLHWYPYIALRAVCHAYNLARYPSIVIVRT